MTDRQEPIHDVAQLGHFEIFTPKPDESLWFFKEILIEAGPAKHNITQAFYLYAYEPGGNRFELFSAGYMIFAPDWEPITWRKTDRGRGMYWGGTLPESFKTYGTPVIDVSAVSKEDLFVFDTA